jgi:glutathione peroxidase-family protein
VLGFPCDQFGHQEPAMPRRSASSAACATRSASRCSPRSR